MIFVFGWIVGNARWVKNDFSDDISLLRGHNFVRQEKSTFTLALLALFSYDSDDLLVIVLYGLKDFIYVSVFSLGILERVGWDDYRSRCLGY